MFLDSYCSQVLILWKFICLARRIPNIFLYNLAFTHLKGFSFKFELHFIQMNQTMAWFGINQNVLHFSQKNNFPPSLWYKVHLIFSIYQVKGKIQFFYVKKYVKIFLQICKRPNAVLCRKESHLYFCLRVKWSHSICHFPHSEHADVIDMITEAVKVECGLHRILCFPFYCQCRVALRNCLQ